MKNASQYNKITKGSTFARPTHFGEVCRNAKIKNNAPDASVQDLKNADGLEFAMNSVLNYRGCK